MCIYILYLHLYIICTYYFPGCGMGVAWGRWPHMRLSLRMGASCNNGAMLPR